MKDLMTCPMHPKAPLIAGLAIIVFTLLGMYGMPLFLWLDVIAGGALVYAGATGNCMVSGVMRKCCACRSTDSPPTDKIEMP